MTEKKPPDDANVLVFRNGVGTPVAVPDEVVTAGERAYRCWKARQGGKSWLQIAQEENYPSPRAAQNEVERYMAEAKALVVEGTQKEMLTLEVARLDALQAAVWTMALNGHIPSAVFALNVIRTRANLLGLDGSRTPAEQEGARTVVVMAKDGEQYVQALQRASDQGA
jgi:hypothetical protein